MELVVLVDTLSSFPLVQPALSSCSAVTVCPMLVAINDDDDDDDGRINFNVAYSPKTAKTRNS